MTNVYVYRSLIQNLLSGGSIVAITFPFDPMLLPNDMMDQICYPARSREKATVRAPPTLRIHDGSYMRAKSGVV